MKTDYEILREQTKTELSPMQDLVLSFYKDYYKQHGAYPTLRQAYIPFGYKGSSSIQRHLIALKRKGRMNNPNRKWKVI